MSLPHTSVPAPASHTTPISGIASPHAPGAHASPVGRAAQVEYHVQGPSFSLPQVGSVRS